MIEEELLRHSKELCCLLRLDKRFNKSDAQKQAEEEERRKEEERELDQADAIEGIITEALSKQMKYQKGMSYSSVGMTFILEGVSQNLFAKAFDVAAGTRRPQLLATRLVQSP